MARAVSRADRAMHMAIMRCSSWPRVLQPCAPQPPLLHFTCLKWLSIASCSREAMRLVGAAPGWGSTYHLQVQLHACSGPATQRLLDHTHIKEPFLLLCGWHQELHISGFFLFSKVVVLRGGGAAPLFFSPALASLWATMGQETPSRPQQLEAKPEAPY